MRTPIELGGGRMTKGMPPARVAASQRIRIQAPKIAGISSRRKDLPVFETGGYSYLHRDVPLYLETFEPVLHIPPSPVPLPLAMIFRGAPLRQFSGSAFPENIRYFNGLIASADNGLAGYAPVACFSDVLRGGRPMLCLFRRPGGCDPP